MELKEVNIRRFGKLCDKSLEFKDGINLIYGPNEAGKSTLHNSIRAMLFGMDRSQDTTANTDMLRQYSPWDDATGFGGSLKFVTGEGEELVVRRNFSQSTTDLVLDDLTLGQKFTGTEASDKLNSSLSGLTPVKYDHAISISQLDASSATSTEMAYELGAYLANVDDSNGLTLDPGSARAWLKNCREEYAKQQIPDVDRQLDMLNSQISEQEVKFTENFNTIQQCNGEISLSRSKVLKRKISHLSGQLGELNEMRSTCQRELNQRGIPDRPTLNKLKTRITNASDYLEASSLDPMTRFGAGHPFISSLISAILLIVTFVALLLISRELLHARYVTAALFFVGGMITAILAEMLQAGADEAHTCKQASQYLTDVGIHFPGVETGDAEQYLNELDSCSQILDTAATCDEHTKRLTEKLNAYQTESDGIDRAIATANRLFWENESIQERLRELTAKRAAYKSQTGENLRLQVEIDSIDYAIQALDALSDQIHNAFGRHLNFHASEILAQLTAGRYTHLFVNEDFSVTVQDGERIVALNSLSQAATEQIYLSLRIAMIQLLFPNQPMPIILDDSFALFDDNRLAHTLRFLNNYDGQVLLFTAHSREQQIMNKLGMHYHYIAL